MQQKRCNRVGRIWGSAWRICCTRRMGNWIGIEWGFQEVDHLDDEPSNNHHVGEDDKILPSLNDDVVNNPNMAMYNPFNDVGGFLTYLLLYSTIT